MGELSDQLGKTVNVYTITETMNEYGDVTKSRSGTTAVVCEIQPLTGSESIVRAGVLKTGDAMGFFAPDETAAIIGNEVSYQDNTYTITGVFKEQIGTTGVYIEAHLQLNVE